MLTREMTRSGGVKHCEGLSMSGDLGSGVELATRYYQMCVFVNSSNNNSITSSRNCANVKPILEFSVFQKTRTDNELAT